MNHKVKLLILAVAVVLVLGVLAAKGFQNSAAYYYTLAELATMDSGSQRVRVKALLVDESVNYDPKIPLVQFTLTDGESLVAMWYEGILPDNFTHADEIIVEGNFNGEHEFQVEKLMLQCPSKYEVGE